MYRIYSLIAMTPLLACVPGLTHAAAFQIQEQNVANLGLAYSGTAALAEDASSAFYNAAGLTRIKEKQLVLSNVVLQSHSAMRWVTARTTFGVDLTYASPDNPGGVAAIPAMHYGARITNKMVFGLSVAAPFGLKTEYDGTSPARYVGTLSSLKIINISPSLAYAFTDAWSIAAGPDYQKGMIKVDSAYGTGATTGDGWLKNRLEDWALGYHAGILYSPKKDMRFGLHYRSRVDYYGFGSTELNTLGGIVNMNVSGQMTLPEAVLASAYVGFTDSLALTIDAQWTHWSRFEELRFQYATTLTDKVTPEQFKNTMRLAMGANWQVNDHLTWRIGTAYDATPTHTATRTVRVPDSSRIWAAIGAHYHSSDKLSFDFGYAHLFFRKAWVDDKGPEGTLARFYGSFRSYANLLGVQVNWAFE